MIETYTSSPRRFEKFDLDKIGTGTEVNRYGFGGYFGDRSVAKHYKDLYRDFKSADGVFEFNGKEMKEGSLAQTLARSVNEIGIQNTKASLDNKNALDCLSSITDEFTRKAFTFSGGITYKVRIPDVEENDLKGWSSDVDECERLEIAEAFYEIHNNPEDLNLASLSALDIDLDLDDRPETFSELSTLVFNAAYEACVEDLPSSIGEYELKEAWDFALMGDCDGSNYSEYFDEYMPSEHIDALKACMNVELDFDNELTWGELYRDVVRSLDADSEYTMVSAKEASAFLSQHCGVVGFTADAMFGNEESKEIIIIDKLILGSAKFIEVTKEMDYSYDLEY